MGDQLTLICDNIAGNIFIAEGFLQIFGKIRDIQEDNVGVFDDLSFCILQDPAAGGAAAAVLHAGYHHRHGDVFLIEPNGRSAGIFQAFLGDLVLLQICKRKEIEPFTGPPDDPGEERHWCKTDERWS